MFTLKYRTPDNSIIIRLLLMISVVILFIYSFTSTEEKCEEVRVILPLKESNVEPKGRNNIYFIESSQPCNGILRLNMRQACSIESAARQNPKWNIFLYVVEADFFLPTLENIHLWKILNSFKNVHVKVIDAKQFTLNTPLQSLFQKGLNSPPDYIKYHRSDLLRYTLLWKYAGTYLDLDVISQRPLQSLGYNFAVAQEKQSSSIVAGAGIINFDSDEVGRKISELIVNDLKHNFNGYRWDDSSVRVLSRALSQICGTDQMENVNEINCKGFKLHPYETFYAINYNQDQYLVEPRYLNTAMTMVNASIGVHAWNKLTGKIQLKKTEKVALLELAKEYCPLVYNSANEYF